MPCQMPDDSTMTAATHTPGPWQRRDTPDYAEIIAADGSSVAMVARADDADLIAAVPDMLAFAESIAADLRKQRSQMGDMMHGANADLLAEAEAVIAKAKGGA